MRARAAHERAICLVTSSPAAYFSNCPAGPFARMIDLMSDQGNVTAGWPAD